MKLLELNGIVKNQTNNTIKAIKMENEGLPFGSNMKVFFPKGDAADNFKEYMRGINSLTPMDRPNLGGEPSFVIYDVPSFTESKAVTVTLGKQNFESSPFYLDTTVKGGKEIRKSLMKIPKVKSKMMVAKLKGKVWHPLFKTTHVDNSQPYQHTFTMKPLNF